MDKDEKEYIESCIDKEGFNYCFNMFSTFDRIEDKEFHRLRKRYRKAGERLHKYIESQ